MKSDKVAAAVAALGMTLAAGPAHAGNAEGNGGFVLACVSEDGTVTRQLFDYARAGEFGIWPIQSSPGIIEAQWHESLLSRLPFNEYRVELYREYLNRFEGEAYHVKNGDFRVPQDTNEPWIPKNCHKELVVFQKSNPGPKAARYFINEDVWPLLDDETRAGLKLHEVIYREALANGATNSDGVANLMARLRGNSLGIGVEDIITAYPELAKISHVVLPGMQSYGTSPMLLTLEKPVVQAGVSTYFMGGRYWPEVMPEYRDDGLGNVTQFHLSWSSSGGSWLTGWFGAEVGVGTSGLILKGADGVLFSLKSGTVPGADTTVEGSLPPGTSIAVAANGEVRWIVANGIPYPAGMSSLQILLRLPKFADSCRLPKKFEWDPNGGKERFVYRGGFGTALQLDFANHQLVGLRSAEKSSRERTNCDFDFGSIRFDGVTDDGYAIVSSMPTRKELKLVNPAGYTVTFPKGYTMPFTQDGDIDWSKVPQ